MLPGGKFLVEGVDVGDPVVACSRQAVTRLGTGRPL
jgi:hypothetical protein